MSVQSSFAWIFQRRRRNQSFRQSVAVSDRYSPYQLQLKHLRCKTHSDIFIVSNSTRLQHKYLFFFNFVQCWQQNSVLFSCLAHIHVSIVEHACIHRTQICGSIIGTITATKKRWGNYLQRRRQRPMCMYCKNNDGGSGGGGYNDNIHIFYYTHYLTRQFTSLV